MTTRDALEAALVARPDDVSLHAAYADLLLEAGEPRGEYVRLQLAAEDRNQPVSKLREYETAAARLRAAHEREWLGDLWPFLQRPVAARSVAEPDEPNVSVFWRRGWIDAVRIGQLSDELVRAVADHPLTRLLGTLTVESNWYVRPGENFRRQYDLQPLVAAGRFATLKHFQLGSRERRQMAEGYGVDEAVRAMPNVETVRLCVDQFSEARLFGGDYPRLHTVEIVYNNRRARFPILGYNDRLPNLNRLYLDLVEVMPERGEFGSRRDPITPSDLLCFFRTEHLRALEHLTFRLGEFGDAGVEELVNSGFIERLRGLDLCRCNITDDGARLLAAHPHVPRLDYLHLDNNLLSPIGIEMLEAVGVSVSPNQVFRVPPGLEFDELDGDEDDSGSELDPNGERDPEDADFGEER